MKTRPEQEIAAIMAGAIGRLHQRPGAMGPDGGGTTDGQHDIDAGQPAVDRDHHEQEQTNPQETPACT